MLRALIKLENVAEDSKIVLALIFDVMNGINELYILVSRHCSVLFVDINECERARPIVRVNYVGIISDELRQGCSDLRKKCKSLALVAVAVECLAVEIIFIVNEIP
jgi:hypothetical protein